MKCHSFTIAYLINWHFVLSQMIPMTLTDPEITQALELVRVNQLLCIDNRTHASLCRGYCMSWNNITKSNH